MTLDSHSFSLQLTTSNIPPLLSATCTCHCLIAINIYVEHKQKEDASDFGARESLCLHLHVIFI